ncbi:MAG: glycosyltransferase family 2 protein, partial [Nitrososphaerales archaeon]
MPLYSWTELSGKGLFKLPFGDFIGQAGMLVRKPVLDAIGYPWFKAGQMDKGRLQEDMTFCRDIQQAGYTVWIDQDQILDHFFVMGISARKHQGAYVPALLNGKNVIVLPDAKNVVPLEAGNGKPRVTWKRSEAEYIGERQDA